MGEGKPGHAASDAKSREAQAEQSVERNTIPEEKSQEVWAQVKDSGVQVTPQAAPHTEAQPPEPGSVGASGNTYGSLKDAMTPSGSGATTDPHSEAGKPKLGQD